MKRILIIIAAATMAAMLAVSCGRNRGGGNTEPADTADVCYYNYDSVANADWDWMAEHYKVFLFYEADVVLDTMLDAGTDAGAISVATVFQAGDTCVMFFHNPGKCREEPEITKENDNWSECMAMTPNNPISLDSCLRMIGPYRCNLPTRKVTVRRRVGPPFPKHGEYIFGNGYVFVDSHTGEITSEVAECGE